MPSTFSSLCPMAFNLTGSPIKSGEVWAANIFPYIKRQLHTVAYYFALFFGGLKGLTVNRGKNREKC